MDWGNLALFWVLGAGVLFVLNLLLFRVGFIRKLLYIGSSVALIACGFELSKLLKEHSVLIGGSTLSWENGNIDTLLVTCMIMLIMVLLMSVGDSLLDFEEGTDYGIDVTEFLGTYFFSVSEERISIPSFFIYYAGASVIAILVYYIFVFWAKWFSVFGVIGCVALGYLFIIKPILIKLFDI